MRFVKTPSSSREDEMRKSIAVYRALIEIHRRTIEQLHNRRRGATDSIMVEIDERLQAQERLIASLSRSIEATELQIAALQKSAAGAGGAQESAPASP